MIWKKNSVMPLACIVVCCIIVAFSGCISQSQPAVQTGDTVKVYYTVSLPSGELIESNTNGTPLEFTVGSGNMIQGFNDAVIGMSPGQIKTVTIPAEKAYGPYFEDRVFTASTERMKELIANMSLIETIDYPGIGTVYLVQLPEGQVGYLKLTNDTGDTMTVDMNNPLAGKDLIFEITLVEIVGQ